MWQQKATYIICKASVRLVQYSRAYSDKEMYESLFHLRWVFGRWELDFNTSSSRATCIVSTAWNGIYPELFGEFLTWPEFCWQDVQDLTIHRAQAEHCVLQKWTFSERLLGSRKPLWLCTKSTKRFPRNVQESFRLYHFIWVFTDVFKILILNK